MKFLKVELDELLKGGAEKKLHISFFPLYPRTPFELNFIESQPPYFNIVSMDPLKALPQEMVSQILSFTSTPTILRFSRVSRSANDLIQPNQPVLNRNVDSMKFNRPLDQMELITQLTRSTELSNRTIREASIDFTFLDVLGIPRMIKILSRSSSSLKSTAYARCE